MLTFNELVRLVESHRDLDDSFRECYAVLSSDDIQTLEGGSTISAHDALSIYKIRNITTQRAGKQISSWEYALTQLASRPADETLVLRVIATADKLCAIFLSQSDELIGCIGVIRRSEEEERIRREWFETHLMAHNTDQDST